MRVAKFGMLGFGALLAARVIVGCSSNEGEPGYDAGTLPDVALGDDAATNGDTSAPSGDDDDAGGDATISGDDAGGSSDDGGGSDTSQPEGTDASDGGHEIDASDAGHEVDASDAGHEVDASDAGHEVDASDAGHEVDASDAGHEVDASDAATSASDASDASDEDASDEDASDASSSNADAGDASDAASVCVSCLSTVSYLGGTAGFVSVGGAAVNIQGGTVPSGQTISITTQTYPQGSVTAGHAHVVWSTDPSFSAQTDAPMTFDTHVGNNDQWYAIVAAPPGSTVYFYLRAEGCDCTTVLYDNPSGPGTNYSYSQQ